MPRKTLVTTIGALMVAAGLALVPSTTEAQVGSATSAGAAAGGDAHLAGHGAAAAGHHAAAIPATLQFGVRQAQSVEHFVDVGVGVVENFLHG